MKIYSIWVEGYRITGDSSNASLMGRCEGKNFKDACLSFMKSDVKRLEYFNENEMSYWGCHLFDNEEDARKSFG